VNGGLRKRNPPYGLVPLMGTGRVEWCVRVRCWIAAPRFARLAMTGEGGGVNGGAPAFAGVIHRTVSCRDEKVMGVRGLRPRRVQGGALGFVKYVWLGCSCGGACACFWA